MGDLSKFSQQGVNDEFARRMSALISDAIHETGDDSILVLQTYRAPEQSAQLRADYTGEALTYNGKTYQPTPGMKGKHLAAGPMKSEHNYGAAADVSGGAKAKEYPSGPAYNWMVKHAAEYGINAYGADPKLASSDPAHFELRNSDFAVLKSGGTVEPFAGLPSLSGKPIPPGYMPEVGTALDVGGYVVQPGDSLTSIASRMGTTVDALAAINNLADANRISAGQLLAMPQSEVQAFFPTMATPFERAAVAVRSDYTVKPGDTLSKIAAANGVDADELARTNGITDPNRISAGQKLKISSVDVLSTLKQKVEGAKSTQAADVLTDLRSRVIGLDVTPRLPDGLDYGKPGQNVVQMVQSDADVEPYAQQFKSAPEQQAASRAGGIRGIPMDQSNVQAIATLQDTGIGALIAPNQVSLTAPNPVPTSLSDLTFPGQLSFPALQAANATNAPEAPPIPLPRPRPETPTVAPAIPQTEQPTAPKMVRLNSGTMAKVGDTAVLDGNVWTVQDNGDGTGKMVKGDAGILKEMSANTVAGSVVRQEAGKVLGQGVDQVVSAAAPLAENIGKMATGAVSQVGDFFGGLLKPKTAIAPVAPAAKPVPTFQPGMMGRGQTVAPVAAPAASKPLAAPGAGLTAQQRNAMSSLAGLSTVAPVPAAVAAPVQAVQPITVTRTPKSTEKITGSSYQVKSGDTLSDIAARAGLSVAQLAAVNGISNPNSISAGQTIKLSGSSPTSAPVVPAKKSTTSNSSNPSSSSVPRGYTDLGNGKFESESGGIYYARNL